MKYNVGDKVVIRSDLEDGFRCSKGWIANNTYNWFKPGEKVVIEFVFQSQYFYQSEGCNYLSDEMIDHEATAKLNSEQSKSSFKFDIGDKVKKVNSPGKIGGVIAITVNGHYLVRGLNESYKGYGIKLLKGDYSDKQDSFYYSEKDIELAEEQPTLTRNFKIGDKVRVVSTLR